MDNATDNDDRPQPSDGELYALRSHQRLKLLQAAMMLAGLLAAFAWVSAARGTSLSLLLGWSCGLLWVVGGILGWLVYDWDCPRCSKPFYNLWRADLNIFVGRCCSCGFGTPRQDQSAGSPLP